MSELACSSCWGLLRAMGPMPPYFKEASSSQNSPMGCIALWELRIELYEKDKKSRKKSNALS